MKRKIWPVPVAGWATIMYLAATNLSPSTMLVLFIIAATIILAVVISLLIWSCERKD